MLSLDARIACCAAELPVELALGIELLKVCPQVFGLFFVLDTGEHLFGPRNLCFWIFDIFFKSLLIPDDSRIFVRIRVAEIGSAPGGAAVKSVEFGTDAVDSARADFVADGAFLKGDRTVVDVLPTAKLAESTSIAGCARAASARNWLQHFMLRRLLSAAVYGLLSARHSFAGRGTLCGLRSDISRRPGTCRSGH